MAKPELEFQRPTGAWRQAFPGVEGVNEQILSYDPDTRDYTRLLRFDPGGDASSSGKLVHDFWEEVYIISGDLTDLTLQETFTEGMYACRPPGMWHGPFLSKSGCLLLEIRYGAPQE